MNVRHLLIGLLATVSFLALICLGWTWYAFHPARPQAIGRFPLQERWHIRLEGRRLDNLISWNDVIYACLGDRICAIHPRDGTLLWQRHLSAGGYERFAVGHGVVCTGEMPFPGAPTSRVITLDAVTGEELWQAENSSDLMVFHLAVGPDVVFVSRRYGLTAYDRLTGAVLWRQEDIGSRIWAEGDYVFDAYVLARQAHSGNKLWTTSIAGHILAAASDGQTFYVCTTNGTWTALDVKDGRVRWSFEGGILFRTFDPPLLAPGILCSGDWTSAIFALDPANGQLLWQTRGPIPVPLGAGNVIGSPVLLDRVIYIRASEDGRVYALSRDTGEGLGHLETYSYEPLARHNLVTAGGLLIVPVGDHELYAFGPPAPSPERIELNGETMK